MAGPQLTDEELAFLHGCFEMAREGRTDELAANVDAGLPVNLTNSVGDTLLILAAYHHHAGTVAMLLARGADHARVNDRGQTALAAAAFRQDAEAVAALLGAGADPDAGGRSARDIAAFFDLPEMTRLLDAARP